MMSPFRSNNVPNINSDYAPSTVSNPKKRRKNVSAPLPPTPTVQDLLPPPLSGYGDTIVASNPFDDCPNTMSNMSMVRNNPQPMGMPPMNVGPPNMNMCRPPMGPPNSGPMHPIAGPMSSPIGNMGPGMGAPQMPGNGHMGRPPMPGNGHMGNPVSMPPGPPLNNQNGPHGNNFMMTPMNNMMYSKPMPVGAGKIYPADQPMVFNSQNPNAPPIYPCGVCHKEVHDNDQAILCESGCNFWFHRGCTGLTETAFQLLTAEVYAEWVCDKCLISKNIPLVKFKP